MGGVPALMNSLNEFAFQLQNADQRAIAKARSYAQSFTSIFGKEVPASYIDLANFARQAVQATGDAQVEQAANQLLDAISALLVAEKHGPSRPGRAAFRSLPHRSCTVAVAARVLHRGGRALCQPISVGRLSILPLYWQVLRCSLGPVSGARTRRNGDSACRGRHPGLSAGDLLRPGCSRRDNFTQRGYPG
jgi:hypothetical protein